MTKGKEIKNIKNCVICGKKFEVYDIKKNHPHNVCGNYKRANKCVTCSKKCALIYHTKMVREERR